MAWLGLEGSRALVIGAGGLGAACARGLAEAEAHLAVVDVDEAKLKALRDDSSLADVDVHVIPADVMTSTACEEAVQAAADVLGGLDVLVHAVGTNDRRAVVDTPDETWERILTLNLS